MVFQPSTIFSSSSRARCNFLLWTCRNFLHMQHPVTINSTVNTLLLLSALEITPISFIWGSQVCVLEKRSNDEPLTTLTIAFMILQISVVFFPLFSFKLKSSSLLCCFFFISGYSIALIILSSSWRSDHGFVQRHNEVLWFLLWSFLEIPDIRSVFLNTSDNLNSHFHGTAYRSHSWFVAGSSAPLTSNVNLGVQGSFESAILLLDQLSLARIFCSFSLLVPTHITLYNE